MHKIKTWRRQSCKILNSFIYLQNLLIISLLFVFLPPINFLHKQADADGNGTIDYDEFITATMHMNRMDREEHLYTAFQHFDKDNSG